MDEDYYSAVRAQSPKTYLYALTAETHLGEVASVIITTLLASGRLNIKQISVKTKLAIKSIKSAIVSLIQLNCLYYWQDDKNPTIFYYSVNETGLKTLVYSGDILNHITQEYGDEEAEIIQNIIMNGHLKLDDYLRQYDNDLEKSDEASSRLEKEKIFLKLYNEGWIKILSLNDFHHINDIWEKLFDDTLRNTPRSSTTSEVKRLAEAQSVCKEKLMALLEKTKQPSDLYITENGYKKLNPNLVLTFNLTRFQKRSRTVALTNLAKSRIGLITSKVYEAALKSVENGSPDLSHPFLEIPGLINNPTDVKDFKDSLETTLTAEKKIVFTVKDVMRYFPKLLDIKNSVITENSKRSFNDINANPETSNKKIKLENGNAFNTGGGASGANTSNSNNHLTASSFFTDEDRMSIIEQHLRLLAAGTNTQFVHEISPGRYAIPFVKLSNELKQFHYESLVKSTLQDQAFRVLRCIKHLKLADEKSIANAVLLKEKTVRNEVYQLIKANVVEIQEIPRSVDRAASKTFYLVKYKEYHRFESLINCLVYNMAEIVRNIQNFKMENKILLDKCNRVDVEGNEDEMLLDSELKTLHGLQNREVMNLVRFNRTRSLWDIFTL
ncbi:RNA polymerase III subunit C82 [Lodderomyces elongisporus]|uniref:RNA polymerase III subunit C82 n=1 Tax=Lodderomyces elongisporus TaxID=36914 RepID=UPI00291CB89D|nr:RNA polymerase III subunit C82 [Lodderomyces elongisporus]WLF76314.1 RNA polymerase III subunit C82 [Lodderomyces elongisporus]